MKYAIYGAGAVGTALGAYLGKAGYEPEIFTDSKPIINALNINGAHVKGAVDFRAPVCAKLSGNMAGSYDAIFVTERFKDPEAELQKLSVLLSETGTLVVFQDGFPEAQYKEMVSDINIIPCVLEFGINNVAPGVCEITTDTKFMAIRLAKPQDDFQDLFWDIITLLEAMAHVVVEDDLTAFRWSKLCVMSAFSGIATIMGCRYAEMLKSDRARKIAVACLNECFAVAKKSDIELAKIQGKSLEKLFEYQGNFKKKLAIAKMPKALKYNINTMPSMLQNIKAGRSSDISNVNEIVCVAGRIARIDTPINDLIAENIKAMEGGNLKPDVDNLKLFDKLVE